MALNQTATITTTCTNGTPYNIGLDAGTGTGATTAIRIMTDTTADQLPYGLFQDVGHTTNWGNTIGTDTVAGTGTGAAQATTVYGQIAAATPANTGSYTDTVLLTVSY